MTPADKPRLAQVVTDVMAYYRQDATAFTLGIWWEAFKGFELEQVSHALTRHATDPERGQFPPKVADIVRLLQGTPTDRAQLAWGKCLDAMQRIGAYSDIVFDDPAIHAVVEDLGGWSKICRCTYEELSYLQHRFCESHKAYTRQERFEYPRMLSGDRSSDDMYRMKGLKPPAPAVVGDKEVARLVYKGGKTGGKTVMSLADFSTKQLERAN